MPRSHRSLILAVVCALAALVPAAASAATPARHSAARAAARMAPARLNLVFPLVAHTAALQRYSTAVSTPGTALYHHYRSIAWLARHFGASPAAERRVLTYLTAHGATAVKLDRTGMFVDATFATRSAERLFSTALEVHPARAGAYTTPESTPVIPAALKGAVTGVVGLNTASILPSDSLNRVPAAERGGSPFASLNAVSITSKAAFSAGTSGYVKAPPFTTSDGTESGCASGEQVGGFTPNQYLDAYGYNTVQATGLKGQGERVALIEVDGFSPTNIHTFDKCFGLPYPKTRVFRTSAAIPKTGLPAGGESTLDLEVLSAAAPDLGQVDVYESEQDIASVLESFTAPLQNPGFKPDVISASLVICEQQVREGIGLAGMSDVEAATEEASDSGISLLAATGDNGSAMCVDESSQTDAPIPELAISFPASSPYVTAVGGTNFILNSANQIAAQEVWNDGKNAPGSGGGGGYSTVFARPSYQNGADTLAHRAIPDVSALADVAPGYDIYCTAEPVCINIENSDPWQPVGGTSAATPLLAGGLALIDQDLRQHKQQNLGLINPLLYALGDNVTDRAQVYDDVTVGSNDVGPFIRSSGQPLGCCSAGVGFDAASGWGSVNLSALTSYALQSQPAIVNVSQQTPSNTGALQSGSISDTVTCSGKCEIGVYARIAVGAQKPQTIYSSIYHLNAAGSKPVKVPIPAKLLKTLRADAARHDRITATVYGAIVDAGGNIESQTPGQKLTLSQ